MSTLEQQMQLVAAVAAQLEEATLQIAQVEDTGERIVFHVNNVTPEQMDNAVPYFEAAERLVQDENAKNKSGMDIMIKLSGPEVKEVIDAY